MEKETQQESNKKPKEKVVDVIMKESEKKGLETEIDALAIQIGKDFDKVGHFIYAYIRDSFPEDEEECSPREHQIITYLQGLRSAGDRLFGFLYVKKEDVSDQQSYRNKLFSISQKIAKILKHQIYPNLHIDDPNLLIFRGKDAKKLLADQKNIPDIEKAIEDLIAMIEIFENEFGTQAIVNFIGVGGEEGEDGGAKDLFLKGGIKALIKGLHFKKWLDKYL
ncbi:hypothetical protein A2335_00115 [Candidatus Peregrinibacteria bacterium RIFOXYB2_FULL_32_7]|nr:MAG: hypothetical protein A2335_00115 [Candidatus Peregrinibacteria bacterium RIFOXYB2_FULL_32_7]